MYYLFLTLFWVCVAIWCFCSVQWIRYTFIKKYKDTDKMLYWSIWILVNCLGINLCSLLMRLTRVG